MGNQISSVLVGGMHDSDPKFSCAHSVSVDSCCCNTYHLHRSDLDCDALCIAFNSDGFWIANSD